MTIHERIWKMAQAAFGRGVFSLWIQIEADADHAIWLWNDTHGPLSLSQREYACDIICRALARAREADDVSHGIALYKTLMKSALTHEAIDAGFKARGRSEATYINSSELGAVFQGIGA